MPDGSAKGSFLDADARVAGDVEDLLEWYRGATELIAVLEACGQVAAGMLGGTPESNRTATLLLDALVGDADLWLLTHPCRTSWNADFLVAIVDTVAGIGRYFEETSGTLPESDAAYLAEYTNRLDWMLEQVRGLMDDLDALRQVRRSTGRIGLTPRPTTRRTPSLPE